MRQENAMSIAYQYSSVIRPDGTVSLDDRVMRELGVRPGDRIAYDIGEGGVVFRKVTADSGSDDKKPRPARGSQAFRRV